MKLLAVVYLFFLSAHGALCLPSQAHAQEQLLKGRLMSEAGALTLRLERGRVRIDSSSAASQERALLAELQGTQVTLRGELQSGRFRVSALVSPRLVRWSGTILRASGRTVIRTESGLLAQLRGRLVPLLRSGKTEFVRGWWRRAGGSLQVTGIGDRLSESVSLRKATGTQQLAEGALVTLVGFRGSSALVRTPRTAGLIPWASLPILKTYASRAPGKVRRVSKHGEKELDPSDVDLGHAGRNPSDLGRLEGRQGRLGSLTGRLGNLGSLRGRLGNLTGHLGNLGTLSDRRLRQ